MCNVLRRWAENFEGCPILHCYPNFADIEEDSELLNKYKTFIEANAPKDNVVSLLKNGLEKKLAAVFLVEKRNFNVTS